MASDMKICIVSDSHDRSPPLVAAIMEAQACGAQAVIHCGDLIGVNTLRASLELGISIHAVHGNNVGDVAALYRMMEKNRRVVHLPRTGSRARASSNPLTITARK